MLSYIIKRVLLLPPVLIGVSLLAFLCLATIPGDPATHLAGKYQDPATIERLRKEFGLDQPLPVQYLRFLEQIVLHQNLGLNRETGEPVSRELGRRFMATIELAMAAMLLATLLGIRLGVAAARKPGSGASAGALAVAYGGISIPIFWLAIVVVGVLSAWLQWFPTSGRYEWAAATPDTFNQTSIVTGLYLVDTLLAGDARAFFRVLHHLALPAAVLATIPLAIIVRLTRASMIEELNQDYVRTARAKGLTDREVVRQHALPNAAIPILTTTGAQFGYLLSGAVLTETVFSWPGLGSYVVDASLAQNTPALMGGILLMSVVFVLVNLATDVAYAVIDPRVRLGAASGKAD
ncbi:MAG: ABC transporter permease [Planctomycetota bacterium]